MKIANANGVRLNKYSFFPVPSEDFFSQKLVGPREESGVIQGRFLPGNSEDKRGSDSRLSIFFILFRLSSRSTSREFTLSLPKGPSRRSALHSPRLARLARPPVSPHTPCPMPCALRPEPCAPPQSAISSMPHASFRLARPPVSHVSLLYLTS